MDVFLCSLLTQPVFLAGVLAFLLENTVPGKWRPGPNRLGNDQEVIIPWLASCLTGFSLAGTRLERGLVQGQPVVCDAPEAWMSGKASKKTVEEYELPFPLSNLCLCVPQSLRCLCPLPENSKDKDNRSSEPGEMSNLLTHLGEQCPETQRI